MVKDFNKYINKKLQPLKKAIQGKELRIFTILIVLQWVIIIFLWSTKAEDGHSHDYEYAEDGHSHWGYAEDGHSHSYADEYHLHNLRFNAYAKKVHTHESGEISAKDISYNIYDIGGFGTLQSEISSLKRKMRSKADSYHSHY